MEKIKNKSIDKDHSLLDEINRQLRDIKNYSEWIDECVDVIKNCLNEMKEKKMSFNSKSTYESSLDRLNIKYHDIIFDLLHCKRVLINDFASTNSFPTSVGINIPRNNNNLKEYF